MFRDLETKPNPFFEQYCDIAFIIGIILSGISITALIIIPWIVILFYI